MPLTRLWPTSELSSPTSEHVSGRGLNCFAIPSSSYTHLATASFISNVRHGQTRAFCLWITASIGLLIVTSRLYIVSWDAVMLWTWNNKKYPFLQLQSKKGHHSPTKVWHVRRYSLIQCSWLRSLERLIWLPKISSKFWFVSMANIPGNPRSWVFSNAKGRKLYKNQLEIK